VWYCFPVSSLRQIHKPRHKIRAKLITVRWIETHSLVKRSATGLLHELAHQKGASQAPERGQHGGLLHPACARCAQNLDLRELLPAWNPIAV
jgi:hypothetical protein